MTTPRDDIAGLIEMLRVRDIRNAVLMVPTAATQLAALSARVAEMTSLLAISEDLRRKVIDVAEQWQARADALSARVKELAREQNDVKRADAGMNLWQARALRAEQESNQLQGMLLLCGELDGIRNDETPVAYLRRLIDGLIQLQQERGEAYERGKYNLDLLDGGLQLLAAAVKAGDPQKEILWRIEEELRQVRRLASGQHPGMFTWDISLDLAQAAITGYRAALACEIEDIYGEDSPPAGTEG